MRFDSRDNKPKIWNIAVLAVAAAALIAALMAAGAEKHAVAISVVLDVFFLAAVILLARAFLAQLQYNPYSYNTIYYVGFSLFLLSVLTTHVTLTVHLIRDPAWYAGQNFAQIPAVMAGSAKTYMLISSPFILGLSAVLCASNISLIRHEGIRFVNVLGFLLSGLLIGGELMLFLADGGVSGSAQYVRTHDLIINILAAVYLYFECMVIGVIAANAITSRYEPQPDRDFLIILGCAIRKDGTPTPLLRDRLDRAIAFRNEQLKKSGKPLTFVTSGGQGGDEVISESAAMKRYLLEKGIPGSQILEEDQSTSTFENMKFSKAKIDALNPEAKIAFATTNYHVFRSGLYARRVKMRAVGMGAKARWYFWPNALVREFIGLLTAHRGKQALILAGLIAVYVALTLCAV